MFSKFLNLPKGLAILLDCILVFGVGIFASMCITVWIAKKYGRKKDKIEEKIKILQECIAWFKVLVFKEVESINSVLYHLKNSSKNYHLKTETISVCGAIECIVRDIEEIQTCYLSNMLSVQYTENILQQQIFENYFCKFSMGNYQKVLDSLQNVVINVHDKKLFSENEIESFNTIVYLLQKILSCPIKQGKIAYIEDKKQFWLQIETVIDAFHLENYLCENADTMLYIEQVKE